ncbi:hypothetical protein [Chitinophaga sp. CF418]|uniref:hypothetical protein n=1 Tax=Chitinophaga sp. CF418 TaxID=1855287 RepID=UPI0009222E9B|nr:hypothetical protein [Chitinophaga sp. CF418]SHM74300.1 hypothetical protein SAMN05216311_103123 [Chitinophaga sp. CF418]
MMYPYIYSLSTVGIIKHYIHDYHFHNKRTDIIGPNGVGKSVLADLLQLIFIFDPNIIRFGTDGVKEEDRQIKTLPYKLRYAYAFINIEVKQGYFLTLGVQINSQHGKALTPFLIASEADFEQRSDDILFGKEKLLYARDFIPTGAITGFDELSDHISEKFGLKLNIFSTKDEINRYYKALYQKEILPLDLSQENSLKAYAKVIQSFSKVKTLNLGGKNVSKNLKDFLFEESDADIKSNFESNKNRFEKFLDDYRQLDREISSLSEKQVHLQKSFAYETTAKRKRERYLGATINELHQTVKFLERNIDKFKEKKLREQKISLIKQNRLSLIDNIKKIISDKLLKIQNQEQDLDTIRILMDEIDEVIEQIDNLQNIELPILAKGWSNLEYEERAIPSVKEMCKDVEYAMPFLNRYESMDQLLQQRDSQQENLEKFKNEVTERKTKIIKLLTLLKDKHESSVLGWFMKNGNNFSIEQIQSILHFAVLPVSQPDDGLSVKRYLDIDSFIKEFDFKPTKNGGWIKLGALKEYIEFTEDALLLKDRDSSDTSLNLFIKRIESELNILEKKLEAIKLVQNGGSLDHTILPLNIDVQIIEYSIVKTIEKALYYINKLPNIGLELMRKHNILLGKLATKQEELGVSGTTMREIRLQLVKKRDKWTRRSSLCGIIKAEYDGDIRTAEQVLRQISKEIQETTEKLLKSRLELDNNILEYKNSFDEAPSITEGNCQDVQRLLGEYENARDIYRHHYIATSEHFTETKDGKNADVQMEISNSSFSFAVMERALLGNRVKATDDIVDALKEANAARSSMADGISDEMLKVFNLTVTRYDQYKRQVQKINGFFVDRKISGHFYFKVEFKDNKEMSIENVKDVAVEMRMALMKGALGVTESVVAFMENSFQKRLNLKTRIPFGDLLDPKTYFHLSARLTDEFGVDVPGSTGETYSAIALLGIARLSLSQKEPRKGLRFLILEELGSLDNTNFNTFPAIADEFQYQIITMAPHSFNIGFSDHWYAHHLIKGIIDKNINYFPSSSFFKTPFGNEVLSTYINRQQNELAGFKSAK